MFIIGLLELGESATAAPVGVALPAVEVAGDDRAGVAALTFGWHYLSNARYLSKAASFVFYGVTCLIRLIEFAACFAKFEENMC